MNNSTLKDRDFNIWLNFFEKEKPSLTKFISLLNKKDLYFLNHPLEVDFENELYEKIRPGGFMEKDFQEILKNENPKETYYKTRLALCLLKKINFDIIKKRIGKNNFYDVIEKSLIDGHYEEYGVQFEKLVSLAINFYLLPKTSLIDIAFFRGVSLGLRYKSKKDENKLKGKVFINKVKIYFGI